MRTKISSKESNVRDLAKIPISIINQPVLELNFLRILSRKRQSCRNLADPRTRDSSRLYICIEKTRKKRRKEKKVREENVSSRRELPTIRFLSRLFFVCHASLFSLGGWILLIVTGESWVKIVRGGWKKKKRGKNDGGEKIGRDKRDARFHTRRRTYCFLVDD